MVKSSASIFVVVALSALCSCTTLTLESVDFGWPVESVVTVSDHNMIDEGRYIVAFSISKLASEEFQDSTALKGVQLRLLRNSEGYYFIVGPGFKHVYVFTPGPHQLSVKSAIEVSRTGLRNPALNQRPPYVELIDGDSFKRLLSSDDIVEGE